MIKRIAVSILLMVLVVSLSGCPPPAGTELGVWIFTIEDLVVQFGVELTADGNGIPAGGGFSFPGTITWERTGFAGITLRETLQDKLWIMNGRLDSDTTMSGSRVQTTGPGAGTRALWTATKP